MARCAGSASLLLSGVFSAIAQRGPGTFRRSVIPYVLLAIIALITAVSLSLMALLYSITGRQYRDALTRRAGAEADQLAATLSYPVWNAIFREIDVQLDWIMTDGDVYAVTLSLKDLEPSVIYRSRAEDWSSQPGPSQRQESIQEHRTVTHQGEVIASLELQYTTRFILADLRREGYNLFFFIIAMDLTLAIGLFFSLRYIVFRPLGTLERFASSVGDGAITHIPPLETARGEIASLHQSIASMVGLLRERYEAMIKKDKEREILIQELLHRTRNNLQVLLGLISLRAHHVTDDHTRHELEVLERHMHAMAFAQAQVGELGDLSSIDINKYLHGFVTAQVDASGKPITVAFSGQCIISSIDMVTPLGLAVVELVSNSLAHGFPEGRSGTISLSLSRGEDGVVNIVVADDGVGPGPLFDPRAHGGLGLFLATSLIEDQLNGRIHFDFSSGFSCTISIPLGIVDQPLSLVSPRGTV